MGKSQNFSPASIDALQSGARQDPLTAGLCVIANGDGRKIWRFRRRVAKSGTVVTLKLGPFPAYSIPAARKWAAALNILIERGEDPRVAMRTEKAQQELTVKKAHEIYMAAMKRGDRKALYDLTENESEDDLIDIDSDDEIPDEDLFDRCAVVKKVANRTWTDVKTSATCTVTVKEAVFEEQETCSMLPQGDVPVNKEIYGIEFPAQTYYDSFGGVELIINLDESGEKPRMILTAQFKSGSSLTQEYE